MWKLKANQLFGKITAMKFSKGFMELKLSKSGLSCIEDVYTLPVEAVCPNGLPDDDCWPNPNPPLAAVVDVVDGVPNKDPEED